MAERSGLASLEIADEVEVGRERRGFGPLARRGRIVRFVHLGSSTPG
jgi:hypothetical protein